MSLRQSSLKDFFPVVARSGEGSRACCDKYPGKLQRAPKAGPLDSNSDDPANQTTEHGAFPFGASDLVTTTTTNVTQNNKRKEEMDESEDELKVKRVKTSAPVNAIDADDEPVYEPNPKRRKVLHIDNPNAGSTLNTDDESFADDEGNLSSSDEGGSTVVATDINDINRDSIYDSDSDDESFIAGEVEESESEEDNWTVGDGNESTLSFASSSTLQPSTPSALAAPNLRTMVQSKVLALLSGRAVRIQESKTDDSTWLRAPQHPTRNIRRDHTTMVVGPEDGQSHHHLSHALC